jgi:hypothetical protein
MDVCEAFCVAVKFYRLGEWRPALPARNTINLDGQEFTLRQVCSLVEHMTRPLPDSVVSDLLTSLHVRHSHLEKRLVTDRTGSAPNACFVWWTNLKELFGSRRLRAAKPISFQHLNAMEGGECGLL